MFDFLSGCFNKEQDTAYLQDDYENKVRIMNLKNQVASSEAKMQVLLEDNMVMENQLRESEATVTQLEKIIDVQKEKVDRLLAEGERYRIAGDRYRLLKNSELRDMFRLTVGGFAWSATLLAATVALYGYSKVSLWQMLIWVAVVSGLCWLILAGHCVIQRRFKRR